MWVYISIYFMNKFIKAVENCYESFIFEMVWISCQDESDKVSANALKVPLNTKFV